MSERRPGGLGGLPGSAWQATRPLRWAALLGVITGAIVAGIGGRVVMRLIAAADPSTDGTFTDARATVGEFTLSGTAEIVLLGTIAGIIGGLLYLGVRRWLPVPPAWNDAAYGVLTLVTVGQPLFDPSNADFQIFEPVLLTVGLFSGLFIVNGLLLGALMDRLHPEPAYRARRRTSMVITAVLGLVFLAGTLMLVGGTLGLIDDEGTCLRATGGGEGCAVPAQP